MGTARAAAAGLPPGDKEHVGDTTDRLCSAGSGAAASHETAVDILNRTSAERVRALFTY